MKKKSTILVLFFSLFGLWLMAQPSTYGLIGYFPMDEGTGDTLINHADDKKIMPNGTIYNPFWSEDIAYFGNSLYFDQAAKMPDELPSYVDFGTYDPSQGKNMFTFTCWLYWNGLNGEYAGITGKRDDWTNQTVHWDLTLKRDGFYQFESMGKGDVKSFLLSPGKPVVAEWEHFALTYNGSEAKMYVNGKLVSQGKVELGLKTDAIFLLGCVEPLGVTPFSGYLDEVRYYNRELAAGEITDIYNYMPSATSGINQLNAASISIFPNPVADQLNINLNGLTKVKLYDYTGKLLMEKCVDMNRTTLDVSHLKPGIYIVDAFGKENISAKILKK
jgi:hypothetical protein